MTFDAITDDALQTALTTHWLGRQCSCFGSVASTQDVARRLAEAGAPDGSTVVADEQTAGRGRQGRRWSSPPGSGIACSIILPRFADPGVAALIIGAGVAAGLSVVGVPGIALKWPNDVVAVGGMDGSPRDWSDETAREARKIAGVLVDGIGGTSGRYVAGIGVNVNQTPDDFPADVAALAISARMLRVEPVERRDVLAAVLAEIERRIDALRHGSQADAEALVEEWRSMSVLVGRRVTMEAGDGMSEGRVVDIQPDGALIVERMGDTTPIYTGMVRLAGGSA